jgi:hypothetical protein
MNNVNDVHSLVASVRDQKKPGSRRGTRERQLPGNPIIMHKLEVKGLHATTASNGADARQAACSDAGGQRKHSQVVV